MTAAFVGDGEGRLLTTPVHKENVTSRSKGDLAQEAAFVLQQAGNLHCTAHDNKRQQQPPGKFSTLPARRSKSNRRGDSPDESTSLLSEGLPPKTSWSSKKQHQQQDNDSSTLKRLKIPLSKLFSPKLERKSSSSSSKPVRRSVSDVGSSAKLRRKYATDNNESDGSHLSSAKKQLSPIIEASPQVDKLGLFNFTNNNNNNVPRPGKSPPPPPPPKPNNHEPVERLHAPLRNDEALLSDSSGGGILRHESNKSCKIIKENGIDSSEVIEEKRRRRDDKPPESSPVVDNDEVDSNIVKSEGNNTLSRSRRSKELSSSTVDKMIHHLSNDRSPPPPLTRTMVYPDSIIGHNNNRPFSYTRSNDFVDGIYAQVEPDKKKSPLSRSYWDTSDEGTSGEKRKFSPVEKNYSYTSDHHQRWNNSSVPKGPSGESYASNSCYSTNAYQNKPSTSGNLSKTSDLSARRDLLESRIKSRSMLDDTFSAKCKVSNNSSDEIRDSPIVVPPPVTPSSVSSTSRHYTSESIVNNNDRKYVYEKIIEKDTNGKTYEYEKTISHDGPESTIKDSLDKFDADKYLRQTFNDDFDLFLADKPPRPVVKHDGSSNVYKSNYLSESSSSTYRNNNNNEMNFSKSEDFLNNNNSKPKNYYGMKSMSTQHLDEIDENPSSMEMRGGRGKYMTRSHENVSNVDYQNFNGTTSKMLDYSPPSGNSRASRFLHKHHQHRRLIGMQDVGKPSDDYDTDISQTTNSQLGGGSSSKYYKETTKQQKSTQKYNMVNHSTMHDEYDSSPPRITSDKCRYDSDTTARDSMRIEASRIQREKRSGKHNDATNKPFHSSRGNLTCYPDDERATTTTIEKFADYEENINNNAAQNKKPARHVRRKARGLTERIYHQESSRMRGAKSENSDYRLNSGSQIDCTPENEQFIRNERSHTDRNMNVNNEKSSKLFKATTTGSQKSLLGSSDRKPKNNNALNKVKQFFSKKDKSNDSNNKGKKKYRGMSDKSITDDELTNRYQEYRGGHLRNGRDADSYTERVRLYLLISPINEFSESTILLVVCICSELLCTLRMFHISDLICHGFFGLASK